MRLLTVHEPIGLALNGRSRPILDEPSQPGIPAVWQALISLSDRRRKWAAYALARAQRSAEQAHANLRDALAHRAQLRDQATACERKCHDALKDRQLRGRDILSVQAEQAQSEARLARAAQDMTACAQAHSQAQHALEQAREHYRTVSRKHEKFRLAFQRLIETVEHDAN